MKKNFKKLVLNKSTLSNLESNGIVGGMSGGSCYDCGINQVIRTRENDCWVITGPCTGPLGPHPSNVAGIDAREDGNYDIIYVSYNNQC